MTGARVLVVDDNRDMARGIAMLLEDAGLGARVAHSAKAALDLLEEQPFDLLLSDVRMPAMSGAALLDEVHARWPATKVVLITAYGTIDAAVAAMRAGASDYLTKPFDNGALLAVVRRVLGGAEGDDRAGVAAVVGQLAAGSAGDGLLSALERGLEVLVSAAGADDGEIFLCEPETGDPLLCVWTGPHGDALRERTRFTRGLGFPGIVAAAGEPLCVRGGLARDPRYLRRPVVEAGVRSLVAAPLRDGHGVVGTMQVMSRRDDFPVERVLDLLQRAAVPLANAVRAELGALRQSVDTQCAKTDDWGHKAREILESLRDAAGAQSGSLAFLDPASGRLATVVSTGPTSLICGRAESGDWAGCLAASARGFVASPGRRDWPAPCRQGLPRRLVSPCCLPLVAEGRLQGLAVLDLGREGAHSGRLVSLLSMAHQVAVWRQATTAAPPAAPADGARVSGGASPPELELRCFGPFTILRRGQRVPGESFTRSKALTLLKLLARRPGAPLHRDVLMEHLWPEVDPRQGANRLHGVVHDLRAVIEPDRGKRGWAYVRNQGEDYYLDADGKIEVDVVRFRALAGARPRGDPSALVAHLEQLVALYRGDLFEDEPFAEWCVADRDALRDTYVDALVTLAGLYASRERAEQRLSCLRKALVASPFREDLLRELLEALARRGRSGEALALYGEYQRRLEAELGDAPSSELRALRARLLATNARERTSS
ncbi:MAG: response regulator [Polyangiaceae bacterium]|nr:response regulator [Polyangiaceae bacterium]